MSRLNPYFNFVNKNSQVEADWHRKQNDEMINMFGIDVKYITKTQENLDRLFGEDISTKFNNAFDIVVLPEGLESYNSGGDIFAKFGFTSNFTITLYIEKERFTNDTSLDEPLIGDLIYIPIFEKYFEITYLNFRQEFFYAGQKMIWKIEVEEFKYSHEEIDTNDDEFIEEILPSGTTNINTDNDVVDDLNIRETIMSDLEDSIDD